MEFTEGPPVIYTPLLRVPWHFPFQAGIAGYRRALPEDKGQSVCIISGEPVKNPNGESVLDRKGADDG